MKRKRINNKFNNDIMSFLYRAGPAVTIHAGARTLPAVFFRGLNFSPLDKKFPCMC